MRLKRHLLTAALALFCLSAANSQLLRTTVEQGEIEGVEHEGFALYKGIPYAEAPVGNLRWKAPVSKKPWKGVFKADKWGDRPPQPIDPNQNGGELGMSEDCLYLSVETPAKSKNDKLPVFVMIHGGAFLTGSYSGTQESFVKEGIIYCSIEYRLGALEFMAHPELNKESGKNISGNYGILDQVMALKWIHDNIAAFGGDPDKITIAGESAGGISVSILCASPLAKGLFRGAISESGSSFWPNVDGYSITDDQYKLYEKGNYNDVNVIIGTNSDEGSMFSRPVSVSDYEKRIHEIYGSWADQVLSLYPAKTEEETYFAQSDIFRDGSFAWGTYAWANLQSKTGKGKVYMYYFDQDSENTIMKSRKGGASHVAEMPFIYGYKFGSGKMTETEQHMEQIMSRYWINFTKTGNPNGNSLPFWATYQEGKPTVMIMKEGLHLGPVQNQKQMDFFEKFFKEKRK